MKLASLLAMLSDGDLEKLGLEHVRTDEKLARPQLCNFLEGALRSYRFVHDFIINRQPPTFAMLTLLLDAPGYQLPKLNFRERAMAETQRLMDLIDSKELLARDDQLRLYRRALYEARRNDLDVNSSEAALLALLRREQRIAQVEHFLIEHHEDLREFWNKDDCFAHEETALRSAGLLFDMGDSILIPEDVAPAIWHTLGMDMPTENARRLFGYLSNAEIATILDLAGSRTSGSKEARIERAVIERIQPRFALNNVGLSTLREICRSTDASVSGNKDELIERIIGHFAEGRDRRAEEPPEPPRREPRQLTQSQFETLFSALLLQELSDILRRFPELRQTGTKETRIKTLWEVHLSEVTLLSELMNRQLEDLLHRLGLRLGGSKQARIERLIDHFARVHGVPVSPEALVEPAAAAASTEPPPDEVARNQTLFRQKASNPQASLQPWLDELLSGNGLVRAYATEDPNPTKQLKNKLSQAAAAQDGLLVLLLADEASYLKAKEALLERWMTNTEWSKSVACVALAHPHSNPSIAVMIERVQSNWAPSIRRHLFPTAEVLRANGAENAGISVTKSCSRCGGRLPFGARFCPLCGVQVEGHESG
jgi:hypothetical protein